MNAGLDRLIKGFKSVKSVKVDGDYIEIYYMTRMGNVGNSDGDKNHPSEMLAWLMEKAREAGKLR
jgi:hypothetical protein